jgi:hypothetical protein
MQQGKASRDPCVDFFHIIPDIKLVAVVAKLLDVAWSRDPKASDNHYTYCLRLRRDVLVPLHKASELPEAYMSTRKWDEIPYDHVASVVMH